MPENSSQTHYRYFPIAERDRHWGLFITTLGESHFGPGASYPPTGHPKGYAFNPSKGRLLNEFQIIYISSGNGWFQSSATSRKKISISAGNLILLFPGEWHNYGPSAMSGWNEHWVGFNGVMAQRLLRHRFFSPEQSILRTSEENRLLSLFSSLMESARNNQPALQQILAGTTEYILALLYSAQQSKLTGDDPGLQTIHQAIARMHEAGAAVLSMPDLAKDLKVGYRWFRRAFAQHTGLTPHQYFMDIRLTRGRDLLAQTSQSVKEISASLGFEDAQYFCKLFHKKVGVTPSAWRAQARKGKFT
jgi:AraC-like DNA-binding protein